LILFSIRRFRCKRVKRARERAALLISQMLFFLSRWLIIISMLD
jgi:hypothetical protein